MKKMDFINFLLIIVTVVTLASTIMFLIMTINSARNLSNDVTTFAVVFSFFIVNLLAFIASVALIIIMYNRKKNS